MTDFSYGVCHRLSEVNINNIIDHFNNSNACKIKITVNITPIDVLIKKRRNAAFLPWIGYDIDRKKMIAVDRAGVM